MEAMRQSWTDERLDDFRGETTRNFDLVDERFDRVERRVENGFGEMRAEFGALNERFDVMHRMMLRFCVLAMTTLFGTLVTLIATQL